VYDHIMATSMIMPMDDECPVISAMDGSSHDIIETSFTHMSGEDSLEACLGITKSHIEPVPNTICHDQSFDRELEKMVASLNDGVSDSLPVGLLLDDSSSMIEASQNFASVDKGLLTKSKCFPTSFDNLLNQSSSELRQSPIEGIVNNGENHWVNISKVQNIHGSTPDWQHEFALPKSVRKLNNKAKQRRERLVANTRVNKVKQSDIDLASQTTAVKRKKQNLKNFANGKHATNNKVARVKRMRSPKKRQVTERVRTAVKPSDFEMEAMDGHRLLHETTTSHREPVEKLNDTQHNEDTKSWTNSTDNCDVAHTFESVHRERTTSSSILDTLPFRINGRSSFASTSSEININLPSRICDDDSVGEKDIINVDGEETCTGAFDQPPTIAGDRPAISQVKISQPPHRRVVVKHRTVLPKPKVPPHQAASSVVVVRVNTVASVPNTVSLVRLAPKQSVVTAPLSAPVVSQPPQSSVVKETTALKPVLPRPVEAACGLTEIQLRHPTIVRLLSMPVKAPPEPPAAANSTAKPVDTSTTRRMQLKPKKIILRINIPDKLVLARKADSKHKPLVLKCDANSVTRQLQEQQITDKQMPSVVSSVVQSPTRTRAAVSLNNNTFKTTSVAKDAVNGKSVESAVNNSKDPAQQVPKVALWKKLNLVGSDSLLQKKSRVIICKKRPAGNKGNTQQSVSKTSVRVDKLCETMVSGSSADETLADVYMKNWKPTGQFQCNVCNYSSVTVNFLFRHWLVSHNGLMPYRCRYCDFQAGSRYIVTRHQSYSHRDLDKCVIVVREVLDRVCQEFEQAFGSSIRVQGEDVVNCVSEKTTTGVRASAVTSATSVSYQCSLCSIVAIRARMICHCMMHFSLRAFSCVECDFRGEDAECVRFHYLDVHPTHEPRVGLDLDAIHSMERSTGLTLSDPLNEIMQAYGLAADDPDDMALLRSNCTLRTLRFSECV
jgi:hypothetical protein